MAVITLGKQRAGRPRPRGRRTDTRAALLFVLPAVIGYLTFFLIPAIRGFWFSFTDYDVLTSATYVGAKNYRRMFDDPIFWNAVRVTIQYVVINIGVQTLVSLGLALLMQRLTQSMVVRGIVLGPYLVANVVTALVWFWILDYQIGVGNAFLEWIGLDPRAFLGDGVLALPTIALINVWRHMGYTALLIFAGLQTIPRMYYEAAAIDGASEFRMFRSVTMPLLRPVMALVLIVTIVGSFQIFDTVAVTTRGGPVNATRVIYYYIYDQAFTRFNFGYASAMSVALFAMLLGVTLLQLKLSRAGSSDLA